MRGLVLAALISLLAGCATVEDSVDIPYAAAAPATRIANAQPIALSAVDGRTADRARISTKINGFGMEMAAIRSKRDVPDVVHDALVAEFAARGFQIVASGRPVTVTIDRFYNQFHVGAMSGTADGEVGLTVVVTDQNGAKLFSGSFTGKSELSIMIAGGANAADSIAAALKDAIAKMFADPGFVGAITSAPNAAAGIGQRTS